MPSVAPTKGAGPKRALIVVDVQKDFMPDYGGPLPALGDGPSLISGINALLNSNFFAVKVGIKDMHPPGHVSFASSHAGKQPGDRIMVEGLEQILFRDHAVQGTAGTDFADGLQHERLQRIFQKGTTPNLDSFSGFFDSGKRRATGLADHLRGLGVEDVYTCGMMTGQCVRATTLDALDEGFASVSVIQDACRGCDGPEDDAAVLKEMAGRGAKIVSIQDCL